MEKKLQAQKDLNRSIPGEVMSSTQLNVLGYYETCEGMKDRVVLQRQRRTRRQRTLETDSSRQEETPWK